MDPISEYHALTEGLVAALGVSHPMMHIHAGLAIYFAAQLVLRDRRASVLGLAWVAFAELANEIIEFGYYGSWRWSDTVGDVVTTLFWPMVIVLVGRYRRRRWPTANEVRPRVSQGKLPI